MVVAFMTGTPALYIMANRKHGTLYTGVTSALVQRVCQHRSSATGGSRLDMHAGRSSI